jgi:hypothetical protein
MQKMMKTTQHLTIVGSQLTRNNFTKHGMHLNTSGNKSMAKHIRQCITILLNKQNSSAIPLQWKEEGESNTLEVSTQEPKDIKLSTPHKNSVRTSCRLRRVPITINKDFYGL